MYKSILKGGINKTVRHRDFPLHKHIEDELYICFDGSATDISEGKAKKVSSGDVYIHKKGITHRQCDIKDFFCCVFQLDKEELLLRSKEMGLIDLSLFEDGFSVDTKAVKYAEIISDILKEEKDLRIRDNMFLSLLTVICSRKKKAKLEPHENIEEVIRYIEHNYDKPLNLDALAQHSRYSRRHFTRLFKEVCGISPMEYRRKHNMMIN